MDGKIEVRVGQHVLEVCVPREGGNTSFRLCVDEAVAVAEAVLAKRAEIDAAVRARLLGRIAGFEAEAARASKDAAEARAALAALGTAEPPPAFTPVEFEGHDVVLWPAPADAEHPLDSWAAGLIFEALKKKFPLTLPSDLVPLVWDRAPGGGPDGPLCAKADLVRHVHGGRESSEGELRGPWLFGIEKAAIPNKLLPLPNDLRLRPEGVWVGTMGGVLVTCHDDAVLVVRLTESNGPGYFARRSWEGWRRPAAETSKPQKGESR